MKTISISKTMTHIIDEYRFTFHPLFDRKSGLIEIEVLHKPEWKWNKPSWKRIYFGHDSPIREALEFYDSQLVNKVKTD